jgi:hypothetical protein
MNTTALKNRLATRTRDKAILTLITASLLLAAAVLAQMPTSPEEGGTVPNRMKSSWRRLQRQDVRDRRVGRRKARGANYAPTRDRQWTKKKSMPRPAHHAALGSYNGKIYVSGGFRSAQNTQIPTVAVQFIEDVGDTTGGRLRKALAPMPTKGAPR